MPDIMIPYDVQQTVAAIHKAEKALNRRFVQRSTEVKILLWALILQWHVLFLSRTGTAKTKLVQMIMGALKHKGATTFLKRASSEDRRRHYFGLIKKKEFEEEGREVREITKSLVGANYAFVDEIFDLPDDVLRDIMEAMDSPTIEEGLESYTNLLRVLFAAANYRRQNEVTEAVLDKFGFKVFIAGDMDPLAHMAIDLVNEGEGEWSQMELPSPEDLQRVTRLVRNQDPEAHVRIPPNILFLKAQAMGTFVERMRGGKNAGYYLSPRRRTTATQLMRLSAILDGRMEVKETDLFALQYAVDLIDPQNGEMKTFRDSATSTLQLYHGAERQLELLSFVQENWAKPLEGHLVDRATELISAVKTRDTTKLPWRRDHTWEKVARALMTMETSHSTVAEWRDQILRQIQEG